MKPSSMSVEDSHSFTSQHVLCTCRLSGALPACRFHLELLGMAAEELTPHVKYSLAKYVDKGEDAWVQQPGLECTLPGNAGALCHHLRQSLDASISAVLLANTLARGCCR